jgi:hypothetical protein
MVITAQIKNEDRIARLAEAQTHLAVSQGELATSQRLTDERLRALIDIVGRDRNGERSEQ